MMCVVSLCINIFIPELRAKEFINSIQSPKNHIVFALQMLLLYIIRSKSEMVSSLLEDKKRC